MNKLGVNEYKLRDIERKIVNLKLNLLDAYFTFNNEELNFKYLIDLHSFLFSDFYFSNEQGTRNLDLVEKDMIELYIKKINYLSLNEPTNVNDILIQFEEIWNLQPFIVGNTRTLIAFLKIVNEAFLLDLNVDVNKNIVNNPKIFRIGNFVNQNRLTSKK